MKFCIKTSNRAAFSLVEVVVVIAILGIMAAVAIPAVKGTLKGSKETVAQNMVETLNNASKEFSHAQYSLQSSPDSSTDDEVHILKTLQWQDPGIELGEAGPFMTTLWLPATSSDTDDYRAVWSGSFWKLAKPGEAGAGLKVDFLAGDTGVAVTHDADFVPFGQGSLAVAQDDPIEVSFGADSLSDTINQLFQTGFAVAEADPTDTIAAIEAGIGSIIGNQLDAQDGLSGVAGEVTVTVDEAAGESEHADILVEALASALLGENSDDSGVTQEIVVNDDDSITITATIPVETGETVSASATIAASDVSEANESIVTLSNAVENAEIASTAAGAIGGTEVQVATDAAIEAAIQAGIAANEVADGSGDVATAEAAAQTSADAAAAAQIAADNATADQSAAAQEAAAAAQAAADAAAQVVVVVTESTETAESETDSSAAELTELQDNILNTFIGAL